MIWRGGVLRNLSTKNVCQSMQQRQSALSTTTDPKKLFSSYFKVAVKRQLSSNILFATITWHECWMPLHLNRRVQNKDWPWLCVSSRYSEQALIIALLVILNSVARSLVIFTLAWMSVTSGFLSPLPPVAVSSSETDLWRAWLCFTMRSLHVLRSSSLVDIIL